MTHVALRRAYSPLPFGPAVGCSKLFIMLQPGEYFHQRLRLHRLDHVVIETGFFCAAAVIVLPPPSQGDQNDAPASRLIAD